ncbi:hypothetical protein CBM15_02490 [Solibacillus kalamii]|uniref:Flagellar biosynthesis protein FlaG n=2 Tax=Solibacillus kalamii TaxID=1748298 RepID=A0ABX3ZMS5_9BACL|nr:hypothetical protein CBM15_02490 [Solibacillus kalamii]
MPNTIQQSTDVQSARSVQTAQAENIVIQENQSETGTEGPVVKEKLEQAIDSINEFFTINNSELKFVLHEGLGKYFAQLVNAETEEVIREIPSKKMLDVFYEMQKLVGMIVDKKI